MKKLYLILTLVLVAAAVTFFSSCEELLGSKPTNVTLEAVSDTLVKITWTAPTEGTPDKYIIYFKAVGSANYTNEDEVTATTYTHDPAGSTGDYYVSAKFGSDTYDSDVKSTIPVHSSATTVAELNATGNSGYGWNNTGTGATFSMANASNVTNVDFYITNFATGFAATPYSVASPDLGPNDPGAVVPTGAWRVNAVSNPITDPQAPLPKYIQSTTYFNYTDITTYPTYLAVKTSDGYFALVKVDGINATAGTVQVDSWFQLINGLRLIKH